MIATETFAPCKSKKLKVKFPTERIEVDIGSKCEFGPKVSRIDENGRCGSNKKSSMPDSKKRGQPGSIEGKKEKRQKIDRKRSQQCASILKSLTSHPYSWVFSKPVDPVALNIPDYFTIISQPMDLGTIKSKLEKKYYYGIEEFAADVRLTFSNAMTYNPPGNDVHLLAKELNKLFDRKWEDLDEKLKSEDEYRKSATGTMKESVIKSCNGMRALHKDTLPKKTQASKNKGIHKISSLAARDAKVVPPKFSQIPCKLIEKDSRKGSKDNHDGEQPSGSLKACPSLHLVTCECSICGDIACNCVIPSNSTRVSSGSEARDLIAHGADASRQDCFSTLPLQRKSDPDSDGAVSSLDGEHLCPSSQLSTLPTDASSGEGWGATVFPVQLSPKKALRAAMLKTRFADTILKAQQKTLLEHRAKGDPLKMQQEKERLERMQREERARIEAQIKTAEAAARMRAEEDLRQRREKEREAARVALEKMKISVEMEDNLEILKELEVLSGCTLSYKAPRGRNGNGYRVAMKTWDKPHFENPLERLGLFIKDECTADEDEEVLNGGREEGEIFP